MDIDRIGINNFCVVPNMIEELRSTDGTFFIAKHIFEHHEFFTSEVDRGFRVESLSLKGF